MTRLEAAPDLHGMRVLVVEDMLMVAEMLAEALTIAGVEVVGPVGRIGQAIALARQAELDGALLDVNLAGEHSGPVAEVLHARGIPFVFLTGYSDAGVLPAMFRSAPRLVKPFMEQELEAEMAVRFRRPV